MKIIKGNILHVKDGYIFHQVNCLGVMGAGLALQIKQNFPSVFKHYQNLVKQESGNLLGKTQVVTVGDSLKIVNVFGQLKIGRNERQTDYDALERAFSSMSEEIKNSDKVYFPYGFGCGLAGGDWDIVSDLIIKYFPNAIFVKYEE